MAMYSKVEYWDERYKNSPNSSEEWYQGYRNLRHLFNPDSFSSHGKGNGAGRVRVRDVAGAAKPDGSTSPRGGYNPTAMETIPEQKPSISSTLFPPSHKARILILGCGNGLFAEDMRNDGWNGRMVNLDFSAVVIEQQQEKYRHFSPKMEYLCHDIREGLPFEDESFDLIISKASFDAILCGSSPIEYARRTIQEVVRCLAPGHGIFFLVTSGNPDSRLLYFEESNDLYHYWDSVRHLAVQRPMTPKSNAKTDYVYISRRRPRSPLKRVGSSSSTEESEGTDNQSMSDLEKGEPQS